MEQARSKLAAEAQFATHVSIRNWVRMGDGEWCVQVGLKKFYDMLATTPPNVKWCNEFVRTLLRAEFADHLPRPAYMGSSDGLPIFWDPALLANLGLRDEGWGFDDEIVELAESESLVEIGRRWENTPAATATCIATRVEGLLAAIRCCADQAGDHVSEARAKILIAAHRGVKINWRKILRESVERELESLRFDGRHPHKSFARTSIGPFLTWYIATYRARYVKFRARGDSVMPPSFPDPRNPSKRPRMSATPNGLDAAVSREHFTNGWVEHLEFMRKHSHIALNYTPDVNSSPRRIHELEVAIAQLEDESRVAKQQTLNAMATLVQRDMQFWQSQGELARVRGELTAAQDEIDELTRTNTRNEASLESTQRNLNALRSQVDEMKENLATFPSRRALYQKMLELRREQLCWVVNKARDGVELAALEKFRQEQLLRPDFDWVAFKEHAKAVADESVGRILAYKNSNVTEANNDDNEAAPSLNPVAEDPPTELDVVDLNSPSSNNSEGPARVVCETIEWEPMYCRASSPALLACVLGSCECEERRCDDANPSANASENASEASAEEDDGVWSGGSISSKPATDSGADSDE